MHLEVEHPVIQHKLSILRSVDTGNKEFRELVGEITMLLAYEALKHVELAAYDVETPLAHTTGHRVDHDMVIVPVLRAGVGMLNSLLALLPTAKIGFVGLFRDHETKQPVEYYSKLPPATDKAIVFLVDPMLATGGSTNAAIDLIRRHGFAQVVILSIVAAPEGIAAVESAHPEVNIYSAAIDDRLDEHKYIVPGLGDAGDRLFGTQ